MHALLSLEHSRRADRVDLGCYASASATLALALLLASPAGHAPMLWATALAGGALWTLAEYALHRFVLHGLPPFDRWHDEHHRRPRALIGSPTLLSASLFALLAAAPALWLLGTWPAAALMFGLLTGYLLYGVMHQGLHHVGPLGPQRWPWLLQRRRWHGQHHRSGNAQPAHFGVTTDLWDRVFGTAGAPQPRAA